MNTDTVVIDTSATVAILQNEPEAEHFTEALNQSPVRLMSVANYVEGILVMSSRRDGRALLERWLETLAVQLVPVDERQARVAADAFERFGKGRHPARLNYGDCFAYALATTIDCPMLFKGRDFSRTDVAPAFKIN